MIGRLLVAASLASTVRACVASDPYADIHELWETAIEARTERARSRAHQPISIVNELIPTEDACEITRARAAESPSATRVQERCTTALPLLRAAVAASPTWTQMAAETSARMRAALHLPATVELAGAGPMRHAIRAQLACRVARLTFELATASRELSVLCDENDALIKEDPYAFEN